MVYLPNVQSFGFIPQYPEASGPKIGSGSQKNSLEFKQLMYVGIAWQLNLPKLCEKW